MAVILVVMRQSRIRYASAVIAVKQWKGIYDTVSTAASCVADNICQTASQELQIHGEHIEWDCDIMILLYSYNRLWP
jgi:hypothetical protein